VPWFNSNFFDEVKPNENTIFNDTYFEINPCKISLAEFIFFEENFSRFEFVSDVSSPIYCFGRISSGNEGSTLKIGSNFLVSALIIFFLLSTLISKTPLLDKPLAINNTYVSSLFFTAIFVIGLILADSKYYNSTIFYFLNQSLLISFGYLTLFIFLILNILANNYEINKRVLINYLPFLFLFSGLVSKSNLNIWLVIFIYFGFHYIKENKKPHFLNIYLFLIFFWAINASTTFVKIPTTFLGFTSTSYDFYSTILYSICLYIAFCGVKFLIINQLKYFKLSELLNNFYIVILCKLLIHYLANQSSVIKFIFEYLFGEINTNNLNSNSFFVLNKELIFLVSILSVYQSFIKKHLNIKTLGILIYFFLNITNYFSEINNSIDNYKEFLISYNPTFLEFIIGSGPLNLNQFLSETSFDINNTAISSLSSMIIFFGMLGCLIFSILYIYFITSKKYGFFEKFFGSLLILSFLEGTGLNNISFFVIYLVLFYIMKANYLSKNFSSNK
jgi:hypothetical protein